MQGSTEFFNKVNKFNNTVKLVLSGHPKIDIKKVFND